MAETSHPSREWHEAIARGVEVFKAGRYADAAAIFERAEALRSEDAVSHLYVALAWSQQVIPGVVLRDRPDMSAIGARAGQEFRRALELDPQDWPELVLLGQWELNQNHFDEARALYTKARDLDAANAGVWCTLGAIAGKEVSHAVRSAQQKPRMPDGTLGPLPGVSVLQQLNTSLSPLIDEGISNLTHALNLNPLYANAMRWLDALLRLRASLDGGTPDPSQAEEWRRKSEKAQQEQNRLGASGVIVRWPAALAGTFPVLRDFASNAIQQLAPPPPPPPPAPVPGLRGIIRTTPDAAAPGWVFRHIQRGDGPPPMLVNPHAQERNLLNRAEAAPPPPGTVLMEEPTVVRVDIVICRDGRVRAAKIVSGDPRFADASLKAAHRFTYRPTLSNGEAVEVRTEVSITPTLS